jgi:protein tyrosine kinase modulator
MVPGRQYSVSVIKRLLWSRRWMIVIPLVVFSGGAIAFSYSLPNLYQSETTILLIPQRVPETYVRTTVTTRLEDRLRTMREQILSRPRLEGLIQEFNLYPAESKKLLMEQLVQRMRDQVNISLVRESSFRIAFTYGDPVIAAKVTEQFATAFRDENLRDRELQADSTSRFLDSQLNDAKRRLVEQEKKLEDYRRRHSGSLPSQFASNLQMIQATNQQLAAINDASNRLRDRRLDLDRQILAQQDAINAPPPTPPAPLVANANPNAVTGATPAQQLEAKRRELETLLLRLQEDHPDVRTTKWQIEELEARVREDAKNQPPQSPRPAVVTGPSPAAALAQTRIRELEGQKAAVDSQLAHNEEEEQRLRAVVASYQSRLEELPSRESELTEITRDYATLQSSYQAMLTKREDSVVAANLERRQIGEQFRVVDPARVPEVPISPNRLVINAIGAVLGLLLGLGTAVLLEIFDKTPRTDIEVGAALGLPTLAMIPVVDTDDDRRRRTRRLRLEALAATVIVLAAGAAAVWKFTAGN